MTSHCLKITQNLNFSILIFPPFFVLLKLTCLVTLLDSRFSKICQNGTFLAFLMNFYPLNVKCDFFWDFQTPWPSIGIKIVCHLKIILIQWNTNSVSVQSWMDALGKLWKLEWSNKGIVLDRFMTIWKMNKSTYKSFIWVLSFFDSDAWPSRS